jgi:hypothetical protein
MPSARSRSTDDAHPVARWLFQAADLGPAQTLVLEFNTPAEAASAAQSLRNFRNRAALAPPNTFETSPADPKGEGRGHFDHIEIRLRATSVALGLRALPGMPEPARVEIVEAEAC